MTNCRFSNILTIGCVVAAFAAPGCQGFAQTDSAQSQTVVTVVPKNSNQPTTLDVGNLQVSTDGKPGQAATWVPLRGDREALEFVVLIDDSARASLGNQLAGIRHFIEGLPPGAQAGVAYMQNGQAVFTQSLTTDHEAAAKALRVPRGTPGSSASPYFCLSTLAKHWPGTNPDSRREVLMVTDGVDLYEGGRFDAEDPYVLAAVADSQRAKLIVYSIFYKDTGGQDQSALGQSDGQDYLEIVSKATGGKAYYHMSGNPVSFDPYLDDLHTRLMNQYELGFLAQPKSKAELQRFKVKVVGSDARVDAPEMVLVPGSEDRAAR